MEKGNQSVDAGMTIYLIESPGMDQVQMPLFNRCILALRLAWRGAGEACEFGPRGGTDGRGRVLIAQTTNRAANHPLLRPLTRAQSARLTRSSMHLISARALHMRSAAGWRVRIRATGRCWRVWAGVGTLCDAPRRESRPPGPHNPRSGRAPATHLNARARTQSGDAAGRGKKLRTRNRTNFCRAPV